MTGHKHHICSSMKYSKDSMKNYMDCTMLNTRMDLHHNNCRSRDRNIHNQNQCMLSDCTIPNSFYSHSNIRDVYCNKPGCRNRSRYHYRYNIQLNRFQIHSFGRYYYCYSRNFHSDRYYHSRQPVYNSHQEEKPGLIRKFLKIILNFSFYPPPSSTYSYAKIEP